MATYFSASNDQKDIMPALYLKESSRPAYPDSTIPNNMVYMNFSPTGSYVGDSSSVLISQSTASHHDIMPNMSNPRMHEHPYGTYGRNEMLCNVFRGIPSVRQVTDANTVVSSGGSNDSHMGIGRPLNIIRGNNFPLHQSNMLAMQGQGLSLSLSTLVPSSIPVPAFQLGHGNSDIPFMCSHQSTSGEGSSGRENNFRFEPQRNTDISLPIAADNPTTERNGSFGQLHIPSNLASVFPNSKYLKVAQQLLDEVINVNRALKKESNKQQRFLASGRIGDCKEDDGKLKDEDTANQPESTVNSGSELSPSEKQDLQNRMTKLLSMLDEVDKRYKQYYHQMEMVMSSFDEIAGPGAAKPYTALALQTISQHFRCLRDAINKQIGITKKSLGEQNTFNGKSSGGLSRLRLIDQQLRQQKSLQQFGMVQQHTWRPQRGLPENSVSILRSWLFEHFLHPYPKDSDKLMLARQTGLTRSQVSNWFINARVRLWKPMVEEMYKEEIGDTEIDSISSSDNATKIGDKSVVHEDKEESQCLSSEPMRSIANQLTEAKSDTSDVQMGGMTSELQNGINGKENKQEILKRGNRTNIDECCFLQDAFAQSDGTGRFMTYQMAELGRFGNGDVSLTLGLHHCDGNLPVSASQPNFVPIRGEEMYNDSSAGMDMPEYDCMSLSNQHNRFNSSHLLHDFVA